MATPKFRNIKLGPGSSNENDFECKIFVESFSPRDGTPASVQWDISTSYSTGNAVLYEGQSYNSLVSSNTGNQPDVSPTEWTPVDGKDGDIWVQVPVGGFPAGGSDSELFLKVNKTWRAITGSNPLIVTLNDNQVASETAFEYPASIFPYAAVEYTIKRGAGNSRRRKGLLIILNDGSTVSYTHEFSEIGFDVQVPLTVDLSAGKVRVRYTSANEGTAIQMRYILRGWN